jgi:hypothetical protein
MDGAKAHNSEEIVKMINPRLKIFLRPTMSANLPTGARNTAADKRIEVATQLKATALAENCFPIAGNAIFMAEPMNGVRKEAKEVTIKVTLSKDLLDSFFIL